MDGGSAVFRTAEAGYCEPDCETANACKEVIAQKRLFGAFDLEFPHQYLVLVDNQSAIALACGPAVHYQRAKHIGTNKFHFQRQLMLEGVVRLQHQATDVLLRASFPRLVALSSGGFIFALKPHQPTDIT
jgi:hypothetical protein